ncbi:MAG: glutaminyl-peptide cyclotransferase [Flavobacterium sp.]|jgi:glutamine cyclotransferase|nr:glutaminyl-peptide cyclotransferase [Flavobacterium sp.]
MKKLNFLSIILLGAIIVSCNGSKSATEKYFSFDESKFKSEYNNDDSLSFGLLNGENKKIDSIVYFVNDKNIGSKKNLNPHTFSLKDQKLGYQNLKALVYFEGENQEITSRVELVSNVTPKLLNYKILNTYPHDTSSFTEGLEFFRDTLYEGTGLRGFSKLLKTDYKTGKIYKSLKLEDQDFGEGITFINNQLFQLTWEEKKGFIYNVNTWKVEKTFTYDKPIEGWGMTNDGKVIYQSDGTEKIWKMNPANQKMIDYVNVYSGSSKIKSVNELEYINGKIYCNIWQKDAIAIVNPENGKVEGIINLASLRKFIKYKEAEVLNGIAYNPMTKTIFVTGKKWEKLFEISVSQ